MDFLKIDGSYGEGGGQIIRSAVALSAITKTPIQIENIRKNRKVPGLRAQHLTGVRLLAKVCIANVEGLRIGSTSIKFEPGEIQSSKITENIGTAGSISLIFQGLIPAVSIAKKELRLSITGGTDVSWSPTANYTKYVLAEALDRMGIKYSMEIKKRGYYPKGGGVVELKVFPCKKIKPIKLFKRNKKNIKLYCSFSKLDPEFVDEYIQNTKKVLEENNFETQIQINEESALNQGGSVLLFSNDSDSIIGSDGLYNTKSSKFSKSILDDFLGWNLGVDEHLVDMLVLPAGISKEMSIFRTKTITKHLETNLYITSKITGCKYGIGKLDNGFEVRITGNSDSSI
ncbi:MAG: RNA 3'-terminal phosphate cyclase [Nitrosopumilaceae archaeon]